MLYDYLARAQEIVKGVNDVIPTGPPVSTELANQLYKVFSEIYVKEMIPIRKDFVKIGTSLKSAVSEEILPIMKKRMETIGK